MSNILANMKELLMKGIVLMNDLGVYHEDLKADNICSKWPTHDY